ncbi:MAG TPA: hypothetical protein VLT86_19660 [Vicinamibacterales bacterium]|nr:hypothetical protein [Vicinamibacterales bacterium]
MLGRGVVPLTAAAILASALPAAQSDVRTLLAATRTALGGDVVLNSVKAIVATGTLSRRLTPVGVSGDVEYDCVLPDQFVRVLHRAVGWYDVSDYAGFNANDVIHRTVFPMRTAGRPVVTPVPPVTTPLEAAQEQMTLLREHRHLFAELTLPLFGASFDGYPLQFSLRSGLPAPERQVDELVVTGGDGFTLSLFLDAATHLPARLTWRASPIVVLGTSSTMVVGPHGRMFDSPAPPTVPSGQSTARLESVEWQTTFTDYRRVAAFNWPHRFTVAVGGKAYEDLKISNYAINSAIDPSKFKTGQQKPQ